MKKIIFNQMFHNNNNSNQMVIKFILILCLSPSSLISLLSMLVLNSCEAYYLPVKYNLDHDLIDYLTNVSELKYYPRQTRSCKFMFREIMFLLFVLFFIYKKYL